MPAGQAGTSTVVTSQPKFMYQPYQGYPQFRLSSQNPNYQYQPYPGYTYQQPQQPQFGPVNPVYPGGYTIPNATPIPNYPRYPPPGTALATQGFPQRSHHYVGVPMFWPDWQDQNMRQHQTNFRP